MRLIRLLISSLIFFPTFALSDVDFKIQKVESTIPQAKEAQKLVFVACSAANCPPCKWMEANVYNDPMLSMTINKQMIPIKPTTLIEGGRKDWIETCGKMKTVPSILIYDENGNIVRKEAGRKTLEEVNTIVSEVLSSNCTSLDEKLDEAAGTRKGTVCCDGLMKKEQGDEKVCVKQTCVETSDNYVTFQGLVKDSFPCCDDSAVKYVEQKLGGGNAKRVGREFLDEYRVTCRDQASSKEINRNNRNSGKDIPSTPTPNNGKVKKSSGNSAIGH